MLLKLSIVLASVLLVTGAVSTIPAIPRQYIDFLSEQEEINISINASIEKIKFLNGIAQQELQILLIQAENLKNIPGPEINEISEKINMGIKTIDKIIIKESVDISKCNITAYIPSKIFNSTIKEMHNCVNNNLAPIFDSGIIANKTSDDGINRLTKIYENIENCWFKKDFGDGLKCLKTAKKESILANTEIIATLNVEIDNYKLLAENTRMSLSVCNPTEKLVNIYLRLSFIIKTFEECVQQNIWTRSRFNTIPPIDK